MTLFRSSSASVPSLPPLMSNSPQVRPMPSRSTKPPLSSSFTMTSLATSFTVE